MQHRDMRKMISILYVLTLLFLGIIYMQDSILNDPAAMMTLQNAALADQAVNIPSTGTITGFQMTGESVLVTILAVTIFFGFALRIARSRPYEA